MVQNQALAVQANDDSVAALSQRLKDLETQLAVANASPTGYPITHYNLYVNGMPVASPETLQDALSLQAMAKLDSLKNGNGFPVTVITRRTIGHPLRNDSVTETEVSEVN